MKTSKIAISKIKEFEGLRTKAYLCPAGVWTIGYGHTLGVKKGEIITPGYANALLDVDILGIEAAVANMNLPLNTQGKWDAVIDWCFNFGVARLKTTTLYRKIKSGAPNTEIQKEFKRWCYATVNGKSVKLAGLVKRRNWEAEQWAK